MLVTLAREYTVSYLLHPEPVQVGHAREQVRKTLPGWGLGEYAELAELIISELVTNAMLHGEGHVEMRLSWACGDLWAEVHDDGQRRLAQGGLQVDRQHRLDRLPEDLGTHQPQLQGLRGAERQTVGRT